MARWILFFGLALLQLGSELQSIAVASGPPVYSARLVAFEGGGSFECGLLAQAKGASPAWPIRGNSLGRKPKKIGKPQTA